MSKKNEKNQKELVYNPALLLKNFVIVQLVIIYFILQIGDVIRSASELDMLLTRYVPIGIVGVLFTFILFKSNVSKCLLTDKDAVKRNIVLGPIIVGLILLGYGLYSVESNIKSAEQSLNSSYVSFFMEDEEIQAMIKEAKSEARGKWLITSVIYIVAAECMVFLVVNKKYEQWLKYEEPNNFITDNTYSEETSEVAEQTNETPLNNIKWDL